MRLSTRGMPSGKSALLPQHPGMAGMVKWNESTSEVAN